MAEIKAIETYYNGYRFRSRLEARWAVFFDEAGIRYQYEPEGFELSDGTYYLPDFYLPDVESRCGKGLWVDVKSGKPGEDLSKVERFAIDVGQIAVLYPFDGIAENTYYYHPKDLPLADEESYQEMLEHVFGMNDFPFSFMKCRHCGVVTYEYQGDYAHHKKDCDLKYYEMVEKAKEIKSYIGNDYKINTKEFSMDEVDTFLRLLYKFSNGETYHNHSDFLEKAFSKAKQARFEHGECG